MRRKALTALSGLLQLVAVLAVFAALYCLLIAGYAAGIPM